MARKIIINNILNLIKDIGGNPNKFMGTKSNINFLGKGPKEALFQGQIDIDGLMQSGFPLERVVSEAERAGGYVTANKLNDFQLQRLQDNLITLKKAYFPEQIPNITDLGTGTGGLTQEGLGSLRMKNFSDKLAKENISPQEKWQRFIKSEPFDGTVDVPSGVDPKETILPTSGLMTRISDRMKNIKDMADELGQMGKGEKLPAEILDPTAEKASYVSKFNPNNEVHVKKADALLKDPQIKGLYTEAEVKNAYDFEGLYQTHFDRGQVDISMLLEQAGQNVPLMRTAARDALLQLMKTEKAGPDLGVGLRHFIDDVDYKFITEGGGGRAGDPINLFAKYFGKTATEHLPKNATKENIDKYVQFLINAKDRRGRTIDDPFFDRDSIDFREFDISISDDILPFETGGRVGFKWGSGLSKSLLRKINKKVIKDAVDDIFPSGDYKMDAELAAEALVENNPKLFGGKLIDDLDDAARSDVYGLVLDEVTMRFGLNIKKKRGIKSLLTDVNEQFGEGTLKRASELPKGTKYETLEAVKDFEARNRTFKLNIEKFMQEFGVSRDEATRISLLPAEEQQAIIQRYINANMAKRTQALGGGEDLSGVSPNYAERYTDELLKDWNPGKGRKPNASGGLAKILEV